jgi:hypothetical protein
VLHEIDLHVADSQVGDVVGLRAVTQGGARPCVLGRQPEAIEGEPAEPRQHARERAVVVREGVSARPTGDDQAAGAQDLGNRQHLKRAGGLRRGAAEELIDLRDEARLVRRIC